MEVDPRKTSNLKPMRGKSVAKNIIDLSQKSCLSSRIILGDSDDRDAVTFIHTLDLLMMYCSRITTSDVWKLSILAAMKRRIYGGFSIDSMFLD